MSPVTWASDGRYIGHAPACSHCVQANGSQPAPTTIDEMFNIHFADAGRGSNPPFVSSIGISLARIATAHGVASEAGRPFGNSKSLAKEELLTTEGFIEEILPDGRFAVRLDNAHKIIAYTAGKMRKFRIRSVVDDRVHLEMTPYDLTKGRIVFRERTPGQAGPAKRRNNFRK